jgi:hypothetical protein
VVSSSMGGVMSSNASLGVFSIGLSSKWCYGGTSIRNNLWYLHSAL